MSPYIGRATRRVCAEGRLLSLLLLILATLSPRIVEAQALPSGWTTANIGSPAVSGSATYSSSTFRVDGGGTRVGLTSDQFFFVYRQMTGNGTVIARVTSVENTNASAKAGVMIRESLSATSRHAFALVTPGKGVGYHRRTAAGGGTTGTNVASIVAPVWLRLVRSGSTITASRSTNGTSWTTIASSTISMSSTVYVGLAVASYNASAAATAVFTNVSVPTSGGTPPTVSLTSPAAGATYSAPATVSLTASATDADNGVASVDFVSNGTVLNTDTTSPYSFTWSNVAAGNYTLTAVARDRAGAVATSAARSITVSGGTTNQPPTVSLTAPTNGATFTAPANVTISANAADADGTVTRVDFYAGSTLVGSDTSSPYSVTWSNAPSGSYSLSAIARDNAGATRTSTARSITINGAPPSRAVFEPSPNHNTSAVTNYRLEVFTSGADPDEATPMATQNLGKPAVVNGECSVSIASTISSLPGGSYFATLVAVGPGGTSPRTASPVFTR
jgi:hypothetical protein